MKRTLSAILLAVGIHCATGYGADRPAHEIEWRSIGLAASGWPLSLAVDPADENTVWVVARLFGVHWNTVAAAVRRAVGYGLSHRELGGVLYIGFDELSRRFLKKWFWWATHSRLKPMRDFAWTLRCHEEKVLNYFTLPIDNGAVEGMNNKAKVVSHRCYGFRTANTYITALYHCLGKLPEPELVHKFS